MNDLKAIRQYKYLDLLICLSITVVAIVNVTSGKITQVSVFTLSAASLCIPITYLVGDVLTEVYGYRQARRATWILIASTILLAVCLQLAAYLPPAPGFLHNDAYSHVFGQVPRVVAGAWVALFCGQFLNDFVLAKMKILTGGKHLWTRTIGSTIVGQGVDTTAFYTIALLNVVPTGLLLKSILSAWFLKVMIEAAITPLTYWLVNRLKKAEGVDHFDYETDFSPFSIKQT